MLAEGVGDVAGGRVFPKRAERAVEVHADVCAEVVQRFGFVGRDVVLRTAVVVEVGTVIVFHHGPSVTPGFERSVNGSFMR